MGIQSAANFLRNFKLGLFNGKGGGGNAIDQDLFAFYSLNEVSGDRQDCGPNDLSMDASGGAFFTSDGILDNAATFQGTFAKLNSRLGGGIIDDFRAESFTACGWANIDPTITAPGYLFGVTSGDMNNDGVFNVFWENTGDGLVLFFANGAGGFFTGMTINGGTPKNTWIFIAITYDADTDVFSIQVNDNQETNTGTHVITGAPTGQRLLIGSTLDTGVLPFKGDVDNVIYYLDRVLPQNIIDYHFKGGGLRSDVVCAHFFNDGSSFLDDASTNSIDLTSGGGADYIVGPKVGGVNGAIEFDGIIGGAISTTSTDLDALRENDFTITVWAYIDAAHGLSEDANILSLLSGFGVGELFVTITYGAGDGISATLYSNAGANQDSVFQQIGGTVPRDTWFSIQVTYNSTTNVFSMRLNDQAFSLTTLTFPTNVNGGLRLDIGNLLGFVFFLEGAIAEPVIYNTVQRLDILNTRYFDGWVTRPYVPGIPTCARNAPVQVLNGDGVVVKNGDGDIITT